MENYNNDLMMEIGTIEVEVFDESLPVVAEVVEKQSKMNPLTVAGLVAVVSLGAYYGYKHFVANKDSEESLKDKFKAKFSKTERGMDTDGDIDIDELDLEFDEEE